MSATCPAHFILLDLIAVVMFVEEHKLMNIVPHYTIFMEKYPLF